MNSCLLLTGRALDCNSFVTLADHTLERASSLDAGFVELVVCNLLDPGPIPVPQGTHAVDPLDLALKSDFLEHAALLCANEAPEVVELLLDLGVVLFRFFLLWFFRCLLEVLTTAVTVEICVDILNALALLVHAKGASPAEDDRVLKVQIAPVAKLTCVLRVLVTIVQVIKAR